MKIIVIGSPKVDISTIKQHHWLPLTWWEVDEWHALMAEPLNLFELLATPQCNATLMEGGQVGAFGRPAHIRLCPALQQNTKILLVCKPTNTVPIIFNRPISPITYCSLFSCDWLFSIIGENGRPLSSFVDHTVLVTTVWVLNPMAHITLDRQTYWVNRSYNMWVVLLISDSEVETENKTVY